MDTLSWRGVFPALTTKFTPADALDFDAMAAHLEFQLDAGVHGVIIMGSLGENATLDADEKRAMVDFFADAIDGRVPLVVTIAEAGTREACRLAEDAAERGADGFMLLPPMRYASSRRETLAWFRAVGAACQRPVMLYNNPVAYGTDVRPEDFEALADVPVFQAIKESSMDTRRIADIRRRCGERYALFCGVDDLAFECFALGAVGWVAGLVVALPREVMRLHDLMRAGHWAEARAFYDWFLPLLHLDVGDQFVQQIKLVEELAGVGSARVRAPRLELDAPAAERVRRVFQAAMDSHPGL
ncbi:MAG TPA: dihydrodipicolinate synthase family protein [Xanthomonadales bacterium]|nr:dihydrodipicolinate synthase family protein [Xanthomonadales bacterium]